MHFTEIMTRHDTKFLFQTAQMTKLVASKTGPPIGALLTAKAVEATLKMSISWADETAFTAGDGTVGPTSSVGIARLNIYFFFIFPILNW